MRGGEFVQIYQRQSQAYVYRDAEGRPRMFRPPKERAEEQTTGISVADRMSSRADLAWQLEVPSMKWSGSAVRNLPGDSTVFSLKDSMSGCFLQEREAGGECFFDEGDDTPYAQWKLVPFDSDVDMFLYEKTPFMLQNSATGNLLHRGDAIVDEEKQRVLEQLKQHGGKRKAGDEMLDEASVEMATAVEDELYYNLDAKPEADIKEDDLFIFRTLSDDWVTEFRGVQQDMAKLHKFSQDLTDYGPQGRKLEELSGAEPRRLGINVVIRKHLRVDMDGAVEAPVIAVLARFLMALTSSSNDDPLTRDGLLNKPLQRMLSEFRLVDFLLDLVAQKMFKFIGPDDIHKETHGTEFLAAVKLIFRLLGQMCKENSVDSAKMFGWLESFLMLQLGYPWKAADVISQMFQGSEDLIRKTTTDLIAQIWRMAREGRQQIYVDFLSVLLVHDGTAIKENQDRVIDVIKKDLETLTTSIFAGHPWVDGGWALPPPAPVNTAKDTSTLAIPGIAVEAKTEPLSPEEETWMKEFQFHVSLVKLAGLLCNARHRASIDLFLRQSQFKFTYELVLDNISRSWEKCRIDRVTDSFQFGEEARLRYTQLVMHLYVDREPFEMRSPNQGIRILPFIKLDSLELEEVRYVDPYKTEDGEPMRDIDGVVVRPPEYKNGQYFECLKRTILQVFMEDRRRSDTEDTCELRADEVRHNEFLCALVDVAKQMLLCGIYDGGFDPNKHSDGVLRLGPETQELAEALLPVLDGRTDIPLEEQPDERHPERTTRFYLSYENGILMVMKRKVLEVMNVMFGMRASTRIEELLKVFYADADGNGIADILEKYGGMFEEDASTQRDQRKMTDLQEIQEAAIEHDTNEQPQRSAVSLNSDGDLTKFHNPLASVDDETTQSSAQRAELFEIETTTTAFDDSTTEKVEGAAFEDDSRLKAPKAQTGTDRARNVVADTTVKFTTGVASQTRNVGTTTLGKTAEMVDKSFAAVTDVGINKIDRSAKDAIMLGSEKVITSIETAQSATFAARHLARKSRKQTQMVQFTNIQKLSTIAEKAIANVSIFANRDSVDTLLTDILVDLTRYHMDPVLAFKAFNTLILFISQSFVFQKALHTVIPIGSTTDATTFLQAMARVSEFRRLRKWLHDDSKCQECIAIVEQLTVQCSTTAGQDLLRNLNLEEYVIRVLRMRLPGEKFDALIRKVLHLVEEFCDSNKTNQDLMAVYVEQIFLKLLNSEKYLDDAAHCLRGLIAENATQSAALSGLMVQHVSTLAMRFGRRLGLLSLLQSTLVVDGEPVVTSQLKVCKGAMMSKDLIEVAGALEKDEWAQGRAIERVEMLKIVIDNSDHPDRKRCELEAAYYCKSLDVLAECANGKNPTTELLCASILPMVDVILRLHEIYDHPDLQSTEQDVSGVKNSTMAFFREVFVDTNSSHILRSLRRPANGIWRCDKFIHPSFAQPIAESVYKDLTGLLTENLPEGNTRTYVFEQCVQFFIQYACVNDLGSVPADELDTVVKMYQNVLVWAKDVRQWAAFDNYNYREQKLIAKLEDVCQKYIANEDLDPDVGTDDIKRQGSKDKENALHTQTWNQVVEAVKSTMTLGEVKGTTRTLGVGIMSVGKALWKTVPRQKPKSKNEEMEGMHVEKSSSNQEQIHYASFLVAPLIEKFESLQFSSNKEELPELLMMLDAVRSIPYGVTAFDKQTTEDAFQKFLNVEPLDSSINPDVSRVQAIMTKQGWGLLCFRVLSMEALPALHLPALRLLLALTGGGNLDVQDELLRTLDDTKICPNEICATNFRRLLRNSVADLKLQRKSKHSGLLSSGKEVGFALEVMQVLRNLTLGDHFGMQVYLQRQPGHPRELDLISDVVGYLSQIERDIKVAVSQTDHEGILLPSDKQMMERTFAAFRVLISMCTGPNPDNQVAVALTDIISVINRILFYCDYQFSDLRDTVSTEVRAKTGYYAKGTEIKIISKDRPRRKLNAQISRLLLTLLAGNPDPQVIQAVAGSLNWALIARHLTTLKLIMTEGYVPDEINRAEEKFTKGRRRKHKLREFYVDDGTTMKKIEPLPPDARSATWIKEEAFKFMTVVQKCYQGAVSTDMELLLDPVMDDTPLVEYFQERLGEVEVVRDHRLERLFFWMPDNYLNTDQRNRAERKLVQFMNAVDRADDETKLRQFIDGAVEVVSTIDQEEQKSSDWLVRLNWAVDYWLPGNAVMFLSLQIVLICVVAFDHTIYNESSPWQTQEFYSLVSHFVPFFGRLWNEEDLPTGFNVTDCYPVDTEGNGPNIPPIGACQWPYFAWYLFMLVALVHLVVCGLAFYTFLEVRVPVLLEQSDREARLSHLKRDSHHARSDRIRFLDCTIHAYGLSEDVANQKMIKMAFGAFGVVAVVRVVKVKGKGNSWAMITFSDPQAVAGLKEIWSRDSEEGLERYVEVSIRGRTKDRVYIRDITPEYIEESATLKQLVTDAEFEFLSRGEEDVLYHLATAVQHVLNVSLGRLGRKIPLQALVILRNNAELYTAIADIVFSVAGFWWSPLLFSYHLGKLTVASPSASIVIQSITTNWGRLLTTVLLSMLALYLFAVSGLLLFNPEHDGKYTSNEGGPCANLLTCVISYSYTGLMQEGVGQWLDDPTFPEHPVDLWDAQSARIVWEVIFMLVTSCAVIAIITGIICDTFGELRMQQDEAAAYRASTCFVTGISYSRVQQEKSTHYLQYMYLLLYLRRSDQAELMPLEIMVRDQVNRGDVRWLPNQRCLTLESMEEGSAALEKNMQEMHTMVNEIRTKLSELDQGQSDLHDTLSETRKQLKELGDR